MPKPHRSAVILFVLLLGLVSTEVNAADSEGAALFGFAEQLFSEGDYYRAITEYKRFIYFNPSDERAGKSLFRIAESYFRAGRWEEAIAAADSFLDKYPESALTDEALYLKASAQKSLKRYSESLTGFEQVAGRGAEPFKSRAIYQSALIFAERSDWEKARGELAKMPQGSPLYPAARSLAEGLNRIGDIPQKSPAVAGILAAVLPGAGHVYTERYRDALVAFLLNGAFIWSAVELFHHDHYVTGGIVTFFEIGWYSGNIYSAVSSAHKYNERSKGEYLKGLQEKSALSISYDPDQGKFLKLSFSF